MKAPRPKLMRIESRVKRLECSRVTPLNAAMAHAEGGRLRGSSLQNRNDRILARDPLCKVCMAVSRVRASVQVDHIVPLHLGGSEHDSNLQGICLQCHEAKSKEEARARAAGLALG